MLKNLKNNKKKGFTLVELIVVLVILAILAALLIPALTGYIDKAKEKSIIAETRQVVMAAQTLGDEAYGKKDIDTVITFGESGTVDVTYQKVADLAEVKASCIKGITWANGAISEVKYENEGYKCEYHSEDSATGAATKYTKGYTVTK